MYTVLLQDTKFLTEKIKPTSGGITGGETLRGDKRKKLSEDLQVGDTLKLIWCGNKIIKGFEEYKGSLDFIDRIVVCFDGFKMSLEKGHYYEVV